jgi:hypothetical protein
MTTVQRVAQIVGWAFVLVGVAGFFVTGMSMDADVETAPRLLGLFPLNVLHNIVHLLFGVWGIVASRTFEGSRTYGRVGGVAYLGLALLGFIAPDMFGLVPIGSHDIWLHVLLGAVLAGVGFTARPNAARTTTVPA